MARVRNHPGKGRTPHNNHKHPNSSSRSSNFTYSPNKNGNARPQNGANGSNNRGRGNSNVNGNRGGGQVKGKFDSQGRRIKVDFGNRGQANNNNTNNKRTQRGNSHNKFNNPQAGNRNNRQNVTPVVSNGNRKGKTGRSSSIDNGSRNGRNRGGSRVSWDTKQRGPGSHYRRGRRGEWNYEDGEFDEIDEKDGSDVIMTDVPSHWWGSQRYGSPFYQPYSGFQQWAAHHSFWHVEDRMDWQREKTITVPLRSYGFHHGSARPPPNYGQSSSVSRPEPERQPTQRVVGDSVAVTLYEIMEASNMVGQRCKEVVEGYINYMYVG